jgi:hypothetical protein
MAEIRRDWIGILANCRRTPCKAARLVQHSVSVSLNTAISPAILRNRLAVGLRRVLAHRVAHRPCGASGREGIPVVASMVVLAPAQEHERGWNDAVGRAGSMVSSRQERRRTGGRFVCSCKLSDKLSDSNWNGWCPWSGFTRSYKRVPRGPVASLR